MAIRILLATSLGVSSALITTGRFPGVTVSAGVVNSNVVGIAFTSVIVNRRSAGVVGTPAASLRIDAAEGATKVNPDSNSKVSVSFNSTILLGVGPGASWICRVVLSVEVTWTTSPPLR